MYILTINAGSSSIKFDLFEIAANLSRTLTGGINNIGLSSESRLTVQGAVFDDAWDEVVEVPDHTAALKILSDWLEAQDLHDGVTAIGHRIVHGGPRYFQTQPVTPELLEELERLIPFDPQHLPVEIRIITALQKRYPDIAQFACFDTAFHHDLPTVARLLPIPRKYEAQGLRRYGFHGLSYSYILQELAQIDRSAAQGRIVMAHMGNGVSLAAVNKGQSIDTTMGLTPVGGVPMSTRSGDLDPGIALYLAGTDGLQPEDLNDMVNFKSGLLGISDLSPDMKTLLEQEHENRKAKDAVDLFCYRVKKEIGALAAAMGGVDTVVFTGGMGEAAPKVRARICDGLEFLGIHFSDAKNQDNEPVISTNSSDVTVRVMHTDEALVIAEEVERFVGAAQ